MADYLGNKANATEQFVTQCPDGSWCCEAETPPLNNGDVLNSTMQSQVNACCSRGSGVWINNGEVTHVNPNGTATSASATAAATHSPSSPTPTPIHHNNTGAIAGGVVGGVAGLVLILAATCCCRREKRKPDSTPEDSVIIAATCCGRRKKRKPDSMPEDSAGQEMLEAWNLHEKHGNERFETDGTQVAGERNGPYEM